MHNAGDARSTHLCLRAGAHVRQAAAGGAQVLLQPRVLEQVCQLHALLGVAHERRADKVGCAR
jgi:hypothetical protein